MNRLNILQINSSKTWAGGEVHVKNLILGLLKKEHNIFLAIRPHIKNHFIDINIDLNILPLKNAFDLYSIFKLSRIIIKNDIDIIHVHNGKDYWLAYFARILAQKGKIVATRHILIPFKKSFMRKKMLENIDKFIAVSNEVKKMLIKIQIPENKIKTIYNGINLELYKNQDVSYLYDELQICEDDFIIGVVGRLCENKNQIFALEIARLINNNNIKFLIVGADFSESKRYRKKIDKLIKDYKLSNQVKMLGYRQDIPNLMNLFDILLIPSKKEAFGLVAVEAMASKTVVLANNVGGLKELIIDDYSGYLLNLEKHLVYNRIIDLYSNDFVLQEVADNAYKYVKNQFNLNQMISSVEKVYLDLSNKIK